LQILSSFRTTFNVLSAFSDREGSIYIAKMQVCLLTYKRSKGTSSKIGSLLLLRMRCNDPVLAALYVSVTYELFQQN